eukprot:scaffold3213_cov123-Cylindrotheca_fusiformis.AAC.2
MVLEKLKLCPRLNLDLIPGRTEHAKLEWMRNHRLYVSRSHWIPPSEALGSQHVSTTHGIPSSEVSEPEWIVPVLPNVNLQPCQSLSRNQRLKMCSGERLTTAFCTAPHDGQFDIAVSDLDSAKP